MLLTSFLAGCQHSLPVYLIQQGMMQGSLYMKAVPISEALKSDDLTSKDRNFLKLSQSVLQYARDDLGLKTKGSYEKYLKLDRPWVSKVVIAAYKDRAEPYLFKFPIFGQLPYRGYFEEQSARDFANKISTEKDLDVLVRSVPAYSTTGWLHDPIVSTMFRSEIDLAELLFHELVHLQFYFDSNADFNEAFATWYAEKSVRKFLAKHPQAFQNPGQSLKELDEDSQFQMKFSDLIFSQLEKAKTFYAQGKKSENERQAFFKDFHLALLKIDPNKQWPQYPELNNAFLVSSSTYYRKVPQLEAFAKSKNLDEKKMLELVMKTGPSIISEIDRNPN